MIITAEQTADIYIATPYAFSMEITLDNVAIPINSVVQITLIDNIAPKKATVKLTQTIVATYDVTSSQWIATIPESQLNNLLTTPTDPLSALQYSRVYLEIEVNSTQKVHVELTVEKGLL